MSSPDSGLDGYAEQVFDPIAVICRKGRAGVETETVQLRAATGGSLPAGFRSVAIHAAEADGFPTRTRAVQRPPRHRRAVESGKEVIRVWYGVEIQRRSVPGEQALDAPGDAAEYPCDFGIGRCPYGMEAEGAVLILFQQDGQKPRPLPEKGTMRAWPQSSQWTRKNRARGRRNPERRGSRAR
jgi:hypothetical protein